MFMRLNVIICLRVRQCDRENGSSRREAVNVGGASQDSVLLCFSHTCERDEGT